MSFWRRDETEEERAYRKAPRDVQRLYDSFQEAMGIGRTYLAKWQAEATQRQRFERLLRKAYEDTHPEAVPIEVLEALNRGAPHDCGIDCLDGGLAGYQAVCWDCGWRGPKHLRGDEEMGTEESRDHKNRAREDAAKHRRDSVSPPSQQTTESA